MNWKRIMKLLGIIVIVLLIALVILLYYLTPMLNGSESNTAKYFNDQNVPYEETKLNWEDRSINVIRSGNLNSRKMILFIHGAPGASKDFSSFITDSQLLDKAQLVSYDRPGYGRSDYGKELISLVEQAAVANIIIDNYNPDSVIVVGYSYGGPISGILAASNNPKISNLVMLAPANSPAAEPFFWFNKLINNKLATFILPDYIVMANREKYSRPSELQSIESLWGKIDKPVYHLHCKNDWIAPFNGNTEFIRDRISNELLTQIFWDGDSHFLPNTQLERIQPLLLKLL